MDDTSQVMQERLEKAKEMEAAGVPLYPNGHGVPDIVSDIVARLGEKTAEELEAAPLSFTVAGRIMALRSFGKSTFAHIAQGGVQIQVYLQKNELGEAAYAVAKKLDTGDIIRVTGRAFRTRTGELTLAVAAFSLLTKNLRPLPEKYHGLKDVETRYRQRYVDLIMNREVQAAFRKRSAIIRAIREFLAARGFLEVETPMMHVIPGGATAKPFRTHHNALDMDLYLRIAPELYLKRLLVGGYDRVFELNRNFRNEGVSTRHNPEFTMLEFYQAHATYEDLMVLTEEIFSAVAREVNGGSLSLEYQGDRLDLTPPWRRIAFYDALTEVGRLPREIASDYALAVECARQLGITIEKGDTHGKLLTKLFDEVVEPKLIQPTFVTLYPLDVSPLSRKNEHDPSLVDRFELFISGREMANAFSELNDPRDQRERFLAQVEARQSGDEEAHLMDDDYIRALEYGMPPAAGEGIGIDRVVMLFTNAPSIRDVILFPHLKREKRA